MFFLVGSFIFAKKNIAAMSNEQKIKSALISVYYKDGLDLVVKKLNHLGVRIYSTGGTLSFIHELGVAAESVESLTGYPSILGGRVKTLHPKVFGGILARRELQGDLDQLIEYEIPQIDLVIVDLYPFEETVASGAADQAIVEKIDIGGISLIRAAAKNFNDVTIVASRNQYGELLHVLESGSGITTLEQRRNFAREAFNVSSHYDAAIFNYFSGDSGNAIKVSVSGKKELRYGENPHQKGAFFGNLDAIFTQLHGKEISYNNLLDIDAAINLVDEYSETTFAILKHNNACGAASRPSLMTAWKDALAGDPISAFGGILITNTAVTADVATDINTLFFEVIIAPEYSPEALDVLKTKKNRIILVRKPHALGKQQFRSLLNGVMVQDKDLKTEVEADMQVKTTKSPTKAEISDMMFANILVKHSKSNAIVLAKDGMLLASGVGQTSRVDALRHAIEKAKSFGFDLTGAVMASDAFFPFADSIEIAHNAGITSVIQPGGSVKDQDTIDYCNANGMAMVFTGVRHFKH
ncbi:IMP cyclohydrolase /phosphoribosylaminoimidazolecarboxamide formyltransferase [Williamwhitmania taraxaci]|uniref:Bifunctional purine biosynthesis protein PurH n=2 Tax=Williamwhitmania taraxaci TaxID=1640674 RepID=A0A1G6HZN2_9BACT|nr:IMP cyclohydrolase /phosphoribosylaminoimidazolecarboxamide formyltransferase [Williamwhitmania taraxaci]